MLTALEARVTAVKLSNQVAASHVATISRRSNEHGDSGSQESEPVSTLDDLMAPCGFSLTTNPSLYLDRARFTSLHIHTAHFNRHTEITLQDIPNREYKLSLFVENVERQLQRKDNHTWTPAQCPYVPCFPNMYTH